MKKLVIFLLITVLISACNSNVITVKTKNELYHAIETATPGTEIVLADGQWNDLQLTINKSGSKNKPLVIRAEHKGKVVIKGKSSINIGAEYVIIRDLYFRDGFSASKALIQFKTSKKVAANCTVTNCTIINFTKSDKYNLDHWVEFWGRNNELSNCYISGKTNQGPTVRVFLKGNESINTHHKIINNYFAERPRLGGPHGETIQIGSSGTSMTPAYVTVADNIFEHCNGEVEVISVKSNFNTIEHNVFFKSEGSLVLRHGNYNNINANIFIGDGKSENYGGIRVINSGHWITNNYFYWLKGNNFRAPLAIMNGIPKSPLNRYNPVTDVVVAYNSWVNCKSPWQIGVGVNTDKKDVLPKSEIRSARPKRMIMANNMVVDTVYSTSNIIAYDKFDGFKFYSNYFFTNDKDIDSIKGINQEKLHLKHLDSCFYLLDQQQSDIKIYKGFGFDRIKDDLFYTHRLINDNIGAIVSDIKKPSFHYGTDWYHANSYFKAKRISISNTDNITEAIKNAKQGDTIFLKDSLYRINQKIIVDKDLVISSGTPETKIIFTGDSAFFEIQQGNFRLNNIAILGKNKKQILFQTAKHYKVPVRYNLWVNNCTISGFSKIINAEKGSFADTVSFNECEIQNADNGIYLAAEKDDKGNYNAEFLSINSCRFNNIHGHVINYYRGGYDESTIGGNLLVKDSYFTQCGGKTKNKILFNTRGITHLYIKNNRFENNPINYIAILWGEKKNIQKDNFIKNSGVFRTEMHLKQTLMY